MVKLPFSNLPLEEVIARVTLDEPLPMGLALVGDLNAMLGEKFSLTDDIQIEVVPGVEQPILIQLINELPAAEWRKVDSPGLTIKLQRRLIRAKWTKTIMAAYPGFEVTLKPMIQMMEESLEVLIGSRPKPFVANFMYRNAIPGISAREIGQFIVLPANFSLAGFVQYMEFAWTGQSGVDRRMIIESLQGDKPQVSLSNIAGLRIQGDLWPALEQIHDELCMNFRDSLTDKAKEEWGYDGNN